MVRQRFEQKGYSGHSAELPGIGSSQIGQDTFFIGSHHPKLGRISGFAELHFLLGLSVFVGVGGGGGLVDSVAGFASVAGFD